MTAPRNCDGTGSGSAPRDVDEPVRRHIRGAEHFEIDTGGGARIIDEIPNRPTTRARRQGYIARNNYWRGARACGGEGLVHDFEAIEGQVNEVGNRRSRVADI